MKKHLLGAGAILLLAAFPAIADQMGGANQGLAYYRANELSLDAFGSASLGKYTLDHISNSRIRHNVRLGAGAGLTYYISRYVGIGGDAYSENMTGAFIDSTSGNLFLRLPVGQGGFAPYVFGGGGHQFDMDRVWFAQVGAGMEYRFTPHIGAFVDARWVLPDKTKYYGLGRLGLRFAF